MKLIDYAVLQGGTGAPKCPALKAVARRVECSPATLYLIAKGHKQCGPKLANRIEAATAGGVTRFDLRADLFGAQPNREAA